MFIFDKLFQRNAPEKIDLEAWLSVHARMVLPHSPDLRMLIGLPLATIGTASADGTQIDTISGQALLAPVMIYRPFLCEEEGEIVKSPREVCDEFIEVVNHLEI